MRKRTVNIWRYGLILVGMIWLGGVFLSAADNLPPSQNPPGGLAPSQVPQFVTIGFDDNGYSGLDGSSGTGGVKWVTDLFSPLKNPNGMGNTGTYDGQQVSVTFFGCTYYVGTWISESPTYVKRSWRQACDKGFEFGNHTQTHSHGEGYTVSQWESEISQCTDWLIKPFDPNEPNYSPDPTKGIGLGSSEIFGFRTPFLEYNNETFDAIKNQGFLYDCSIEEGWQWEHDGSNYLWPYTLDNGSPGHDLMVEWEMKNFPLNPHPGIWEMPPYPVIVPPDDKCAQYGVPAGLRAKMKLAQSWFDEEDGKITGLDYNLWVMFKMTKAEFLATMKYTLDQRLAGNRCPFMFGAHSDEYSSKYSGVPNATCAERQQAIQEFIQYALSKPEVRVVSIKKIIDWLRNPVPLEPVVAAKDDFIGSFPGIGVWQRNSDTLSWMSLAPTEAVQISSGDFSGDKKDDLIGWWNNPSGVWLRDSASGSWSKILDNTNLVWISAGDLNGDGLADLLGSWSFGVWWRNTANGQWERLHEQSATMVAATDVDKDGEDDLLGVWSSVGIWSRLSATGAWSHVLTGDNLKFLASGDLNGDGYGDLLGSWTHGTWYRNSATGSWVYLYAMAEKVAAGDLDGDKKDDLVGTWSGVPGVWSHLSAAGAWQQLHSANALWFAVGQFR